jgi:hypothetical protein
VQSLPRCSNGKDLNRDFPDPLAGGKGRSRGPLPALGTEQPETAAVMRWAASRPFVAAASMHEVCGEHEVPQSGCTTGIGCFNGCNCQVMVVRRRRSAGPCHVESAGEGQRECEQQQGCAAQ